MRKNSVAVVLACCLILAARAAWSGPLANGELSVGPGGPSAPDKWFSWNDTNADPEYVVYRSAANSWMMRGNAGIFQDIYSTYYTPTSYTFYAGDIIKVGAYLRTPSSDPLRGQSAGYIRAEFWNMDQPTNPVKLSTTQFGAISAPFDPTDTWIYVEGMSMVPTSTAVIRVMANYDPAYDGPQGRFLVDDISFTNLGISQSVNLLRNGELSGVGSAPSGWQQWNDGSHDAWFDVHRSPQNSWCFWWDGGLYQDVAGPWAPGFYLDFSAWFLQPSWDPLRNGTKSGEVSAEFYNGSNLVGSYAAKTNINATRPTDTWLPASGSVLPPGSATTARVLIRCANFASGDGRFMADDAALRYRSAVITTSTPTVKASGFGTACIVQSNPAVAYWTFDRADMGKLVYARCSDAEGTGSWTSTVVYAGPAYDWGAPFPSMAIVQGNPAIAVRCYTNDGDLFYFRCSTADGLGAWTSVVVDVTDNAGVDPTLLVANGKPVISALTDKAGVAERKIRYYQCSSSNGVGTWTGRTLAVGYSNVFTRTSIGNMLLLGGNPAIAYRAGTNQSLVYLMVATNANGDGTWRTNLVESSTNDIGQPNLALVGGRPAMAYVMTTYWHQIPTVNTGVLRYALSPSAAGTGTWSVVSVTTNVGREAGYSWDWYYPVRLSVYNAKPVIAYTAKCGLLNNSVVAYAVSATTNGVGAWTSYNLAQGGFVGSLLQHNGRPLVVHEGVWGVRMTR